MRKDVSNWESIHEEYRGINKKEWLRDPVSGRTALFKETQIKSNSESTYADYGESLVADICKILNVSCAEIELVTKNGILGCISYNFCNPNDPLEELNDLPRLIQNVRPKFNSKSMIDPETKECYGIEMILEAIELEAKTKTNFALLRSDFFKGLLTDSIIDHYDRNPSNLSVIKRKGDIRFSPKYDNGTALSISVPEDAIREYMETYKDDFEGFHEKIGERIFSKIGYLGRSYVKYPDLETFIFNYYYDDVKDFISVIQEKLTDEAIEQILKQEKYDDLPNIHKEMIKGKLKYNRDKLLERFRTVSKKQVIDKILYNKRASDNFKAHLNKGTITAIIPEYQQCVGVKDADSDYDLTLDEQIPSKIQSVVDIVELARYFNIPIKSLTKREKSLIKWNIIMENIQKACPDEDVFGEITTRLGFLPEDNRLLQALIKDKFKDENDVFEAREIIFGENGIGLANVNLYFAKKFVDATVMRPEIREKRYAELRKFAETMQEAIELEHIIQEKDPIKINQLQKIGVTDMSEIKKIQLLTAKYYKENPRAKKGELYAYAKDLAISGLKDVKEEIMSGIFIDHDQAEDIRNHTIELENGDKLTLYDRCTKNCDYALKMGADYYAQIVEHPSGDGVTLSIISKQGKKFPKQMAEYAQSVIKKYSKPDTPRGSFVYRESIDEHKTSSRFIVTTVKDPNVRIPNITVPEMSKKIIDLLGEKQREKSILDD